MLMSAWGLVRAGRCFPRGRLRALRALSTEATNGNGSSQGSHQLVTFYSIVRVEDPEELVKRHKEFCRDRDIRGRIYISEKGINGQLSGPGNTAMEYANFVLQDPRFQEMPVSCTEIDGHAFPKLRVKHKAPVQMEGEELSLPVEDPEARATPLDPQEWKEAVRMAKQGELNAVMLDVRNEYEWEVGHFEGFPRPNGVNAFRETHERFKEQGPLSEAEKDRPVLMYCTGGIRCEMYSAKLKQEGFKNVYQLKGGVERYLRECGPEHWNGALFTFDARLAVASDGVTPASDAPDEEVGNMECYVCGGKRARAPHRNCANVDCNRLFLVCSGCIDSLEGFCCDECRSTARITRPLIQPGSLYGKVSNYASSSALHARRGPGRYERRKRNRGHNESGQQMTVTMSNQSDSSNSATPSSSSSTAHW